jgi:hypothetical protein
VSEPWPLSVLCPLCPFMCLPISRLFLGFISSLPQLAWDKRLCCCCCWGCWRWCHWWGHGGRRGRRCHCR